MTETVFVPFENRLYAVRPDMRLIAEIESELTGLPALLTRFHENQWHVSDLVTLIQMFLQSSGRTVDYHTLGNAMLASGLTPYIRSATQFLSAALKERHITAYSFRKKTA